MSLNREQLKKILLEELSKISELSEFSESRSGKNFIREGNRIRNAGKKIYELGTDQTGRARQTIRSVGKFIHELGDALSSINELNENETADSKLPPVSEYKKIINEIKKLSS